MPARLLYAETRARFAKVVCREYLADADVTVVPSIAEACRILTADSERRKKLEERIKATPLRSWDDVLHDFISAIESNGNA